MSRHTRRKGFITNRRERDEEDEDKKGHTVTFQEETHDRLEAERREGGLMQGGRRRGRTDQKDEKEVVKKRENGRYRTKASRIVNQRTAVFPPGVISHQLCERVGRLAARCHVTRPAGCFHNSGLL